MAKMVRGARTWAALGAAAAGVLMLLPLMVFSSPAQAHWNNYCDAGRKVSWGDPYPTYSIPDRWSTQRYGRLTIEAVNHVNAISAMQISRNQVYDNIQFGSNDYGYYNGTDGFAQWYYSGDCTLLSAIARYNEYFTRNYSDQATQSVGAHELGHATGVGHIYSNDGCRTLTIMQPNTGCRWDQQQTRLHRRPHDQEDLNRTYG